VGKGGLLNASLGGKFPTLDFAAARLCTFPRAFRRWYARCISASVPDIQAADAPHSLVLSFIGACLLWVGWFGFNAGKRAGVEFAGQ